MDVSVAVIKAVLEAMEIVGFGAALFAGENRDGDAVLSGIEGLRAV